MTLARRFILTNALHAKNVYVEDLLVFLFEHLPLLYVMANTIAASKLISVRDLG